MPTHFARNLQILRVERGYSQRLLGRLAGLDQQRVSTFERGLAPQPKDVAALARALDVSEDALFVERPSEKAILELLAKRASGEERS